MRVNVFRPCRNAALVAALAAIVLASMPAEALAAAPSSHSTGAPVAAAPITRPPVGVQVAAAVYPVTGTVRYYPLYSPSDFIVGVIGGLGCAIARPSGFVAAVACYAATTVISSIGGSFFGYWADYVYQSSQVFVHMGGIAGAPTSRWDIYLKTGNFIADNACISILKNYGPLTYGASWVGNCPRVWWADFFTLMRVLSGGGL